MLLLKEKNSNSFKKKIQKRRQSDGPPVSLYGRVDTPTAQIVSQCQSQIWLNKKSQSWNTGSNTTPVVSKRHRRYEEICEEIPGPWNKQRRRERGLNHLVSFSCEVEMWKETFYVLWSLLSHHFLFHHLSLYQYQSFWFQCDVGTRTVDFFLALLLWFSLSLSSVIQFSYANWSLEKFGGANYMLSISFHN